MTQVNVVTDACDSKLVALHDFSMGQAQVHFLRLRLQVLLRLLLGDVIVVPQGWALDSLPFIKIASELIATIKKVRADPRDVEIMPFYSPIKMECHISETTYIGVLLRYLERDDCVWSGFPILRQEPERRAVLYNKIKNIAYAGSVYDADAFADAATSAFVRDDVPEYWSQVASYFSACPSSRIIKIPWPRNWYTDSICNVLSHLDYITDDALKNTTEIQELRAFWRSLPHPIPEHAGVSFFVDRSRQHVSARAQDALLHISTYAQIRAAAVATHSKSSAPEVRTDLRPGTEVGDRLVRSAFSSVAYADGLFFGHNVSANSDIAKKLVSANWSSVWENAVELANDKSWKTIVREIRNEGAGVEEVLDGPKFRQLENMLEERCPDLILRRTGAERLGLKLSKEGADRLGAVVDRVYNTAAGGAVGTALTLIAQLAIPGATMVGTCIGLIAGAIIPESKGFGLNPFKRHGLFASRTSIFRANQKSIG